MAALTLHVVSEHGPTHGIPLGATLLTIGRAPSNHLVLNHDHVSGHHAIVWVEGGKAWVRDLGSTNGTFVNEERIGTGGMQLAVADRLGIGPHVRLELRGSQDAPSFREFGLTNLNTGQVTKIVADRFVFRATGGDLEVPGLSGEVVLLVHPGDEFWLGSEGRDRPVALGEVLDVGGSPFRITVLDPAVQPTLRVYNADRYRTYALISTLTGPTGPESSIEDLHSRARCELTGNRAVLLYVLGRAWKLQAEQGVNDQDCGWCSDEDVATDIWGRAAHNFDANNLNVLVYRARDALRKAGFEDWCIEKRKGFTRLRVSRVRID